MEAGTNHPSLEPICYFCIPTRKSAVEHNFEAIPLSQTHAYTDGAPGLPAWYVALAMRGLLFVLGLSCLEPGTVFTTSSK